MANVTLLERLSILANEAGFYMHEILNRRLGFLRTSLQVAKDSGYTFWIEGRDERLTVEEVLREVRYAEAIKYATDPISVLEFYGIRAVPKNQF